jgi:hypothetical protein
MAADPADVDSAEDVRAGWDEWSYDERLDALGALANSTLDQLGYDEDVDVYSEYDEDNDAPGYHDEDGIHLDASLVENPDPDHAIHVTNHEMVHEMNEQDGVDDYSYNEDDDDFDFTGDELDSMERHAEAGDIARALDHDGATPPGGAGGGSSGGGGAPAGGGSTAGSEYEGASDAPSSDDLTFEIDWASGVWIDTTTEDGSMSVDLYFTPMEGW